MSRPGLALKSSIEDELDLDNDNCLDFGNGLTGANRRQQTSEKFFPQAGLIDGNNKISLSAMNHGDANNKPATGM